jgi:hypothetical protein
MIKPASLEIMKIIKKYGVRVFFIENLKKFQQMRVSSQ